MRHTKWKTWGRALALVAVLAMLPAAPAISALQPVTAPNVEAALVFEIGSVVTGQPNPDGEFAFSNDMVLETEMSGFDRGEWEIVRWPRGDSPSRYAFGEVYRDGAVIEATLPGLTITDDDGSFGGGSQQNLLFDVIATNPGPPAAETSVAMGAKMFVVQQDGEVLGGYVPDAFTVTTKGKWLERKCKCWLGGTGIRTLQKWARVEFTVTADEGQVIAVIMPMAPNRGEAKIKLDGVNQGKVDSYSAVKRNRVVMWQTPPLAAGSHTVSVINLATPGHGRIDVDAFAMTEGIVPSPAP